MNCLPCDVAIDLFYIKMFQVSMCWKLLHTVAKKKKIARQIVLIILYLTPDRTQGPSELRNVSVNLLNPTGYVMHQHVSPFSC